MHVTLLDLRSRCLALQQPVEIRQVVTNIVRMSDGLEARFQHLAFGKAQQIAERVIHAQPCSLWRYERHANRRVIKCIAKVRFRFTQSLADALLLGEVAVQLLNVTARLFRLGGGAFDVLHVRPIGEVDDRNNRNSRRQREETDVPNEPRNDSRS